MHVRDDKRRQRQLARSNVWHEGNFQPSEVGDFTVADKAKLDALPNILHAEATLVFGTVLANSSEDRTITVTGAILDDAVAISVPASLPADMIYFAWVSAADTVTIRAINPTGGGIVVPDGTYRALVFRF